MDYPYNLVAEEIEKAYLADEIDADHYDKAVKVLNHLHLKNLVRKRKLQVNNYTESPIT